MARNKNKTKKQGAQKHRTTLDEHARHKSTLVPPLATLDLTLSSWVNQRLPESLWPALLLTAAGRKNGLYRLERGLKEIQEKGELWTAPPSISGLGNVAPTAMEQLLTSVAETQEQRRAWRPLLLFPDLPARETWIKLVAEEPNEEDWKTLANVVADLLFHQSQLATDCRWFRVACFYCIGRLHLPSNSEVAIAMFNYAHEDVDGGLIRAAELPLSIGSFDADEPWPTQFWHTCWTQTPCMSAADPLPQFPKLGTSREHMQKVRLALTQNWRATTVTTAVDARHDAAFGLAFYSLSLLEELLGIDSASRIQARATLRMLTECRITFAYLAKIDKPEVWAQYRSYGAGQAKLAFLKLDRIEERLDYVNAEELEALANEDLWEEYRKIELGHWQKLDLRKLSEGAGVKDDYDRYYDWPSGFIHGHWGAVRDAVFETCGSPLHRLHRIPRGSSRSLPDVVTDACKLVDKILETLNALYPGFAERVALTVE